MYNFILALHNALRWFVLIALVYAVVRAFQGLFSKSHYNKLDDKARLFSVLAVHTQLILGVALYFVSPVLEGFFSDFATNVKIKGLRFFALEHSVMMLAAVVLITVGSAVSKRKETSAEKFRTIAIFFTIALVIILAAIPWVGLAEIGRPNFRSFF